MLKCTLWKWAKKKLGTQINAAALSMKRNVLYYCIFFFHSLHSDFSYVLQQKRFCSILHSASCVYPPCSRSQSSFSSIKIYDAQGRAITEPLPDGFPFIHNFTDMYPLLPPWLAKGVKVLGFTEITTIQACTLSLFFYGPPIALFFDEDANHNNDCNMDTRDVKKTSAMGNTLAVAEEEWQYRQQEQEEKEILSHDDYSSFLLHPSPHWMNLFQSRPNIVGLSTTGSGKTLAFVIPLLAQFQRNPNGAPAVLVLCPVRELVQQTARVFREVARFSREASAVTNVTKEQQQRSSLKMANNSYRSSHLVTTAGTGIPHSHHPHNHLSSHNTNRNGLTSELVVVEAYGGGRSWDAHLAELNAGCDVLIACPGRLANFVRKKLVSLAYVQFVVVDEADRMLDMGVQEDLERIFRNMGGGVLPVSSFEGYSGFCEEEIKTKKNIIQMKGKENSCSLQEGCKQGENNNRKIMLPRVLMWSATWSNSVQSLAAKYLGENQILIKVKNNANEDNDKNDGNLQEQNKINKNIRENLSLLVNFNVEQQIIIMDANEDTKIRHLVRILSLEFARNGHAKILIFVNQQVSCIFLLDALQNSPRLSVEFKKDQFLDCVHGGRDQSAREVVFKAFEQSHTRILIATDIAARGLDISDITTVINYDISQRIDAHCHRIGRTARAGRKGRAITFVERQHDPIRHKYWHPWVLAGPLAELMQKIEMPYPEELGRLAVKYEEKIRADELREIRLKKQKGITQKSNDIRGWSAGKW